MNNTKKYYNENALEYYQKRNKLVIKEQLDFFLPKLNQKDLILDLGCGSCNNLFEIRKKGYNIIGADFSEELIKIAQRNMNEKVYLLDFSIIEDLNNFIKQHNIKHIFASASLLHLKKNKFKTLFENIELSGYLFFSLKEGYGQDYDNNGRFFSYYQKDEIEKILYNRFKIIDYYKSQDSLGRNKNWINWIVKLKKNNSIFIKQK